LHACFEIISRDFPWPQSPCPPLHAERITGKGDAFWLRRGEGKKTA